MQFGPLSRLRAAICVCLFAALQLQACDGPGRAFAPSPDEFVDESYNGKVLVLTGFRPCPVGRSYEKPLVIEAFDTEGMRVLQVPFSGLGDGRNPVDVPLYFPAETSGRVYVRVAECPSWRASPRESLHCSDARFVRTFSVDVGDEERRWRDAWQLAIRRSRCADAPETGPE